MDADHFYVACERVFDPRLAGRPVVVLSNNDACVPARSTRLGRGALLQARFGIGRRSSWNVRGLCLSLQYPAAMPPGRRVSENPYHPSGARRMLWASPIASRITTL